MSELADLAREFAEALVGRPQSVRVRERQDGTLTMIELEMSPEDRGRVIGRGGTTVAALRTLLAAIAKRRGMTCRLEVAE
jgi:predicted RNA-binding protein YlqC (UPF0109 family)